VSALRRRVLANSLKTSNAISLPGITSLNRSGFDAIILYHFDAAELAPSTASKADICSAKQHIRFTPESGHVRCTSPCLLWARSGHATSADKIILWGSSFQVRQLCKVHQYRERSALGPSRKKAASGQICM